MFLLLLLLALLPGSALWQGSGDEIGVVGYVLGPGGHGVSQQYDGTGARIIGPLPRGITALALDMPFYAQTRLPNVVVNGADALIDGGAVAVQPGAVLQIDLVDETGTAVPDLPISLEDTRPLSPLPITQLRTNQQGRGRVRAPPPRGAPRRGAPPGGSQRRGPLLPRPPSL